MYNKNTHTYYGEKLPDCIDEQGHYFKTCNQCSTMICRRCYTHSYDYILSMGSSYGDFSGTSTEYDRYCDKCNMLVKRGIPIVYSHSFKCYKDWEEHRIKNKDTKCRMCDGNGTYHVLNKSHTCSRCEGTGKFPSPSRIKKLEKMKKDDAKYPKLMSKWDLFIELFRW